MALHSAGAVPGTPRCPNIQWGLAPAEEHDLDAGGGLPDPSQVMLAYHIMLYENTVWKRRSLYPINA